MDTRLGILTAAFSACLVGCAGAPLIDLPYTGLTRATSATATAKQPMTLEDARAFLFDVRGAYRDAMSRQLSVTQHAGAGLVALGAAVVGLAAGKAHSDAILGASLLGGASYAIGNLTLDRRRVLAFDAGIRALDCAYAAVVPLDIGATTLTALDQANKKLIGARAQVREKVRKARSLAEMVNAKALLPAQESVALKRSLAEIDAALEASEKTSKDAAQLGEFRNLVGRQLQNTVNSIVAKVDGFIGQTVQDLTAVSQAVAGLGGFAAAFAPGAGIEKTFAGALGSYAKSSFTANAGASSQDKAAVAELKDAMKQADEALGALLTAAAEVSALLGVVDGTEVINALKVCNVNDVVLPLTLEPLALVVDAKGGPGKGFAIKGGTKPYMVRWLDVPADGLSLTFNGGFADSAQVSAASTVPADTYLLLVSDSANVSRQLVVTVNGKPAAENPLAPGATDLAVLAKTINGLSAFNQKGTTVGIVKDSAKVAGGKVSVSVSCTPKPAVGARLNRADVADALLAAAKSKVSPNLIEVQDNPDCLVD